MKILFLISEFSGLKKSIKNSVWDPTGAPTIYRLIEELDKRSYIKDIVIFSNNNKKKIIKIKGLNANFIILNKSKSFLYFSRVLSFLFNMKTILSILKKTKNHLVYVDRANVVYGAILSKFFKKNVVLRIMGIYPDMLEINKRYNFQSFIERVSYKAPFSEIICTEDGTPGKEWLNEYTNKKVRKNILLNGFDKGNFKLTKKVGISEKIRILFVGRLEKIKGCQEFVDVALNFPSKYRKRVEFIIVGNGSLKKNIMTIIKKRKMDKFIQIMSDISHKKLNKIFNSCDIYVSLNKLGSLSNSNIEAMCNGKCCIFLNKNKNSNTDNSTYKLISDKEIIKVSRENTKESLTNILVNLIENPKIIETYSSNISALSNKLFKTWKERIMIEIRLLKKLI